MNDKTRIILEALESHGENGCGIISLSLETGYPQESLRKFLKKHKKYCIPVNGESKYKLNRETKEQGSVANIIASIDEKKVTDRLKARVPLAFFWGVIFGVNLPLIMDLLYDFYNWLF